jgi:hypothetical protein
VRENKFKLLGSASKAIASVFQGSKAILLVGFLMRDATINSERYVQTLKKLKQRTRSVQPIRKTTHPVLLLHDNTRPHGSPCTTEATATMVWTALVHPPYSPELLYFDLHLSGPLKEAL